MYINLQNQKFETVKKGCQKSDSVRIGIQSVSMVWFGILLYKCLTNSVPGIEIANHVISTFLLLFMVNNGEITRTPLQQSWSCSIKFQSNTI